MRLRLPPLACSSHHTRQVIDDDMEPLCINLGRFKRLRTINLVSKGMCERGGLGAEEECDTVVECVQYGCR